MRLVLRRLLVSVVVLLLWAPAAHAWTRPGAGPVLAPFSYDESHPYAGGQHRGIDLGSDATGAPVVAPAAGTISYAGTVPTSGKSLTIQTPDGYSVTLTHLGSLAVAKGAQVDEGAVVGTVGPSGTPEVEGPYVHLGIRLTADPKGYLDPASFLPPLPDPAADTGSSSPTAGTDSTSGDGSQPAPPPPTPAPPTSNDVVGLPDGAEPAASGDPQAGDGSDAGGEGDPGVAPPAADGAPAPVATPAPVADAAATPADPATPDGVAPSSEAAPSVPDEPGAGDVPAPRTPLDVAPGREGGPSVPPAVRDTTSRSVAAPSGRAEDAVRAPQLRARRSRPPVGSSTQQTGASRSEDTGRGGLEIRPGSFGAPHRPAARRPHLRPGARPAPRLLPIALSAGPGLVAVTAALATMLARLRRRLGETSVAGAVVVRLPRGEGSLPWRRTDRRRAA